MVVITHLKTKPESLCKKGEKLSHSSGAHSGKQASGLNCWLLIIKSLYTVCVSMRGPLTQTDTCMAAQREPRIHGNTSVQKTLRWLIFVGVDFGGKIQMQTL